MKKEISNMVLWWILTLSIWCSSTKVNPNSNIENISGNVNSKITQILTRKEFSLSKTEINKKCELSKNIIWDKEYWFFIDYFNLYSNKEIIEQIYSLQNDNWLKTDWVIWDNTLKTIYLNYYSKLANKPSFIEERLNIYNEMEWYKSHKWRNTKYWKLYPSKVPNIFSRNYYYWIWKTENIKDSFINKDLLELVHTEINRNWNTAVIFNRNWNFFVAVYVEWRLELVTYISPWTDVIKWWMKTLTWNFKTTFSDKYHISWARDSIKETNKGLIWAVMPYALHITWWIYAHAWYVNGQRKSHWCIRLPIYYAKWLYDIFEKKWNIDWFIYDN